MKRLLSAVLTVIMLIGILPANAFAATEYPFTDVSQNAWYRDAVEYCHINGLIMGTSDTEFSPDVKLTRAMFVTMLARLAKADLTGCSGSSFTDVKAGSWYAPSVEWAYRNNITGGTGNGKFSPDSPITREQICRFFHNYIKTTDAEVVYDNSIIEKYKDVGEISSWASRDVEFAVANSIINSTSQKELTVSPKVIVTRSQAAQFFMNFKDRFYAEFPLDSKTELDNYCRNNAEIGCNETLLLRWEGETSEIVLSDGSSVMLEKGRRYNITFTRKSSLDISYSAINELTWTLTLDTNGGEMSADSEYIFREDEAYTAVFGSSLPMPEKRGYSFTGWYCEDKEYLLDLKDSFSYEENVTFRALWSANDYTVTFDSNGGKLEGLNEFIVNINDNYYEVLAELCEPSRIGYSFEGWYCDNYKLDLKDDFDYSENIIFKAKWEAKSYKISFENGEEFTVKYDQKISDVITEIPVINKTGYTFVSWFCEDKDYTFDIEDSFTFTDDLILTATWEANSYKIFFENGEEYTVKYDQKFSDIIPVIPYAKRTGYSFLSWYCEGEDYIFSLDDTFRFPNDISFKAKWSANSYTVSFDPNGGSLTGNTVYGIDYDVCWTDVISAEPIPMREGYSFAGWYYGEYRFDIEDSFRFTDDITFVAKWEANSYKIFFENGEEFTVKYDQKISDVITEIPVINKTGYTFVSWFCEDKDYTFDIEDSFTFTDDLILTATWESNTYKISFENGDKFLVKYDQNIGDVIKELPRIEKEGYTFVSWYCESEDYTFDANDIFNFTNDIFFTAEWEANSYMLSFENGDKFLVKYDQRIGDFIKELPKIEKIGYTFISWYCTDKDYTLETDDVFSFTESLYFKAVWEANSYKIFFENGEEYTVKYDQKISDVIKSIPVIEKNGYSFKSWYCEAYNYILNTDDTFVFTEDVSFISKWTPNTYRISFENGEEFTVKYDQKISDVITEIPVINKTGYTFVSWCCDSEDYILDTEDIYNFTESLYFRAVWEANSYKIFFENGEEFTVKYDQKISDIITDYPAIQKTGYTFLSWYCESEDYTFDANDIFNFTNDMFFTAEWEANSYKIFFENGEEFTVKYDQKISDIITDDPEIQKTGYTFLSWYCKSEDYTFDANDIFNFTNDIFFTAEWEANSYMLSFENGEEYTVKYDQKISDIITDDPEIQKTGYTFLSWYCKSEDYTFDANDIFNFTNDIFFTAEWEANSYMLSFENGDKFLVKYDQNIGDVIKELPRIEKEGYTFVSWYCESEDYILDTEDIYNFTESLYFKAVWEANTYKISFENGEEYTVKYDQKISDVIKSIPVIEKNGYSFKSWYCEAYNYTLNTDDTFVFTEDVSFIAKWTPNTYRISFENGEEFTVKYDQKISDVITEIPVINKTGYIFVSWFCEDKDYTFDIEDSFTFTDDLILTATWEANSYKIFFENGEEFTVKYDQKISDVITEIPVINKTGYTFVSWYCTDKDYTLETDDIFSFTESLYFKAVWQANTYKISFENGEEYTVKYDQKISDVIKSIPVIEKNGYSFKSWYCEAYNYILNTDDTFVFTEDVSFIAKWIPNTYRISFENGDKFLVKYDQNIGDVIKELPRVEKKGYTFVSWYCESEDYILDTEDIYNFTESLYFKAVWEANTYKIFFENGEVFTVKYDQRIGDSISEIPITEKIGYTFDCWYYADNEYVLDLNDVYTFAQDIYFKAVWNANTYTMKFENGIEFNVKYDQSIESVLPSIPVIHKRGHTFLYWYCEEENYILDTSDVFNFTKDISFKAVWEANKYTVTFDAEGAEISGETKYEITYGQKFSEVIKKLPYVVLKGNEFHGWYNRADNYLLNLDDSYTYTEDTVFNACWKPIDYLISFDPDGGVLEGKKEFTLNIYDKYCDVLTGLGIPERTGYTFVGWYYGDYRLEMLDSFSYAMNTVFTAKWEVNSYTLTFENGEKYTVNYDQRISDVIPLLPVIEKTGYTFKSWYAEELNYTFDVDDIFRFAEDLYFVARWSPNTYKVYFENGEKYLVEYDQQIGEVICDIPVIERAGYSFVSWYCESEDYILNTEDIFNFTVPLIFKAVWCANEYTISFDDGSEYAIKYDQRISEVITSIPVIEKTGYTFLSWCCESENYTLDTDDIYRFTNDISFKSVWSANSYTVSFENGESYTVSYDQKLSDVIVNIPVTERTGYSFLSWYCEDEDYTLDTEDIYCFANDISFEAVWSANSYTVSFENGESYTVRYDQKLSDVITSIPVTEKVGHTFVSWYCECENYTLDIDDIYRFTNDISFKAVWSANSYTISFDNGESYTVRYGQKLSDVISSTPVTEKVGHTFVSWYCESEDCTLNIDDIYHFANDIDFIAVWRINVYTITFENGAEYYVEYGQRIDEVITDIPVIEKVGHTFEAWYCEDEKYIFEISDIYNFARSINFTAVWTPNTYTVAFENGAVFSVRYGQSFSEVISAVPAIKKTGYTFKSWYCQSNNYTFDLNDTLTCAGDVFFRAVWEINKYTVSFEGGITYTVEYSQRIDEIIAVSPIIKRSGYTFKYWYCDEQDYILDTADLFGFTEDLYFKAIWSANAYTITLDANGGELIGESVYGILYDQNISEVISELPVATNGFYELQYWYCEESDYILDIDKPYSVPDNIILKAVWKDEDPFGTAEEMVREYRENMLELYDREKRSEEIVDIILFAGQSNSCGRATADEISDNEDFMTVDESKAFTFYNNKFTTPQKIEEPITGNGTDSKYYGYIPTFLNTYYDNTGRRVCACFKSVGGMMMNNFLPYTVDENGNEINSPAKYYKEMVEYINHAKLNLEANGYTVGNILMVWCQGEADAAYYGYENNYANVIEEGITEYGDKVDYYKRTFTRMFESLQADAGLEKAFIVRIGHSNRSEECLRNQPIIDAHTQLCSENEDLIMVSTLFAGAKTFRMPDGTEVNLMRDASHYLLEGYLMAGKEAGLNAAIYVNSEFNEKPMLLEYHRRYLESQGLFDTNEYEHEYLRYIFDPDRINT